MRSQSKGIGSADNSVQYPYHYPIEVPPEEYLARQRGETPDPRQFEEPETLTLAPLPCWKHLSPEQYRGQMAGLVQSVEATAEAQRKGKQPLGREAILRQEPAEKPEHTKRSPAPRFHAFRARVRKDLYHLYAEFVAAFRVAAEMLKSGDRHAAFPIGSFPPHLPFVRAILSAPPAWA